MAEYIDKKCLDRKFQIDMMCLRGGTIFDTQRVIDSLPTADVIGREKIDKAIEEIKDGYYGPEEASETDPERADAFNNGLSYALDILERNIGG